jgi:ATP-binding cassette subfamily B protein
MEIQIVRTFVVRFLSDPRFYFENTLRPESCEEETMKDRTLNWLYSVPGKKKCYILFLIIIQALNGASGVLYALFMRNIVDAATDHNVSVFWREIVLITLLVIIQISLRAVIRWLTELSKAALENLFKARLMDTLLSGDHLRVSAVHSGEWLNRLTNDTVVVANGYVEISPGLVGMLVKLASAVVMIIVLEPRFAAILIPCGLLLILLSWLSRKVLKVLHKNVQETDGKARVFLQERLTNMFMIRSFAAEHRTMADTEMKLECHKAARMRKTRFFNLCNMGFSAAMSGMYLLGVGWCGYGILMGTITFGTLTAITQLISQIQSPFANISGYIPRYYAMQASAERLMEAESFERGMEDALPMKEIQAFYEKKLAAFGLRDADFVYYPAVESTQNISKDNMPAVLNKITIEIKKGEYVCFTGQSGCGKSTVLKLLTCVYRPDGGERYYQDEAGCRSSLTSDYRRLFAYVPQGNALMSGTIREVVSFADGVFAHDEERLWNALKIACADGFVKELDDGVDTLLGERGTGLSEGQMQRLAIARAVFSGSPILLLDEATSALDEDTEKQLLDNLRRLTDKTVITVTHRPAVLSICDRVLHFTENGVKEV